MPDNSSERGARVDGGACARGGSSADGPEAGEEGTRAQGAKPGPATPEPDEFHASRASSWRRAAGSLASGPSTT